MVRHVGDGEDDFAAKTETSRYCVMESESKVGGIAL